MYKFGLKPKLTDMQTRWISCVSWYSRDVLHLSPLHANKKGTKSRMNHSTMSDLKSLFTGATLNFTNSTMAVYNNGQAAVKEERGKVHNFLCK